MLSDDSEVVRKLKSIKYLDYLETSIGPALPRMAESCLSRLLRVLTSLMVDGLLSVLSRNDTTSQACSLQKQFVFQETIDKNLRSAFLEAFHLKLTLMKSSPEYDFRFPKVNELFDGAWMEPLRLDTLDLPQTGQVCLCLRPAIISVRREALPDSSTTIVKALVLLEWNSLPLPTNDDSSMARASRQLSL